MAVAKASPSPAAPASCSPRWSRARRWSPTTPRTCCANTTRKPSAKPGKTSRRSCTTSTTEDQAPARPIPQSSGRTRLHGEIVALRDSLYSLAELLARQVQLISALQIHPESGRHAEVLAEAESRVRRHVPLPSQNLVEPVGGHLDNIGEPFRRKADLFQFVAEDFSGVNGCAWHVLLPSSVVVDNLNIRWAQLILGPLKADAPLAVDPNGMLPLAVSLQGFETDGIEGGKIPQRRGGVENA